MVLLTKLKEQKCLNLKKKFYTFDVETRDGLEATELFCAAVADSVGNSIVSDTIEDLIEFMMIPGKYKKWVFIQNISFEARYLFEYFDSHNIDYHRIESGSTLLGIATKHTNFIDSYQFLQEGQELAEITWEIDEELRKINCLDLFEQIPYEKWSIADKQRLRAHNRNDVLALMEIMKKLRETLFEIANVDIIGVWSPSSLSINSFRKVMDEDIHNSLVFKTFEDGKFGLDINEDIYDFIKGTYKGGRTERIRNSNQELVYADIVSMYPTVMKKYKFPTGRYLEIPNKRLQDYQQYLDFEGFVDCDLKTNGSNLPFLGIKHNERFSFVNGDSVNFQITLFELRKALEYGYSVNKINRVVVFEQSNHIFATYVDKIFKIKSESKGGKRKLAKLLLNSLYGKFGQRIYFDRKDYRKFESRARFFKYCLDNQLDYDVELSNLKKVGRFYVYARKDQSKSVKAFNMPHIAAYVTAYARYELYEAALKVGIENVHYCDTDSLVITKENADNLNLGKNLGDWEFEKEFKLFWSFAPKCYVFIEKGKEIALKAKGLGKTLKQDVLDEISNPFQRLFKFGSLDLISACEQTLKRNEFRYLRFMKYKEAINRTGSYIAVKEITKEFDLLDHKRIWVGNESTPLILK